MAVSERYDKVSAPAANARIDAPVAMAPRLAVNGANSGLTALSPSIRSPPQAWRRLAGAVT